MPKGNIQLPRNDKDFVKGISRVTTMGRWLMAFFVLISIIVGIIASYKSVFTK